ncbi:hypothetical protein [Myceligenerans crystallogenes]
MDDDESWLTCWWPDNWPVTLALFGAELVIAFVLGAIDWVNTFGWTVQGTDVDAGIAALRSAFVPLLAIWSALCLMIMPAALPLVLVGQRQVVRGAIKRLLCPPALIFYAGVWVVTIAPPALPEWLTGVLSLLALLALALLVVTQFGVGSMPPAVHLVVLLLAFGITMLFPARVLASNDDPGSSPMAQADSFPEWFEAYWAQVQPQGTVDWGIAVAGLVMVIVAFWIDRELSD